METDASLLPRKSLQALRRYGHHIVIGNLLQTRKHTVTFYTLQKPVVDVVMESKAPTVMADEPANTGARLSTGSTDRSSTASTDIDEETIRTELHTETMTLNPSSESSNSDGDDGQEIESMIVRELVRRHQLYVRSQSA